MRRPNQHLERLTSVHKWVVTESKPFKGRHHINLLEREVLHREYLDVASRVKGGLRAVNLTDSRVVFRCCGQGPIEQSEVEPLTAEVLGRQLS